MGTCASQLSSNPTPLLRRDHPTSRCVSHTSPTAATIRETRFGSVAREQRAAHAASRAAASSGTATASCPSSTPRLKAISGPTIGAPSLARGRCPRARPRSRGREAGRTRTSAASVPSGSSPRIRFSTPTNTMLAAISGSTTRLESVTTSSAASASVTEWATVKQVTMAATVRTRRQTTSSPSRNKQVVDAGQDVLDAEQRVAGGNRAAAACPAFPPRR